MVGWPRQGLAQGLATPSHTCGHQRWTLELPVLCALARNLWRSVYARPCNTLRPCGGLLGCSRHYQHPLEAGHAMVTLPRLPSPPAPQ